MAQIVQLDAERRRRASSCAVEDVRGVGTEGSGPADVRLAYEVYLDLWTSWMSNLLGQAGHRS